LKLFIRKVEFDKATELTNAVLKTVVL